MHLYIRYTFLYKVLKCVTLICLAKNIHIWKKKLAAYTEAQVNICQSLFVKYIVNAATYFKGYFMEDHSETSLFNLNICWVCWSVLNDSQCKMLRFALFALQLNTEVVIISLLNTNTWKN